MRYAHLYSRGVWVIAAKLKERHVIECVHKAVNHQDYRFTRHAVERMKQRGITLYDIEAVLAKGSREVDKDVFNEDYRAWTYAFKGKGFDGCNDIRVAVGIENAVIVVTAIKFGKKRSK